MKKNLKAKLINSIYGMTVMNNIIDDNTGSWKSLSFVGHPILLYSDDKNDCYYNIFIDGIPFRKSLTIKMLKSSIKQMHEDWRCEGYGMRIIQDALCPADIHLIPIKM